MRLPGSALTGEGWAADLGTGASCPERFAERAWAEDVFEDLVDFMSDERKRGVEFLKSVCALSSFFAFADGSGEGTAGPVCVSHLRMCSSTVFLSSPMSTGLARNVSAPLAISWPSVS
jgi:hypothetical protein